MTDDKFDLILDAALREYVNAEPRAGIEQRVMRRVQSAPRERRLWPVFLTALAAIPLAFVILHRDPPGTRPPLPQFSRTVSPPTPAMPPQPVVKRHKPPARQIFSEPEPLTAEERELLRFVQSQPEQAREALSLSARIEEITIEPLKIEELVQEP